MGKGIEVRAKTVERQKASGKLRDSFITVITFVNPKNSREHRFCSCTSGHPTSDITANTEAGRLLCQAEPVFQGFQTVRVGSVHGIC